MLCISRQSSVFLPHHTLYFQAVSLAEQDLEGLEGTLFEQMIELYGHLRNEMLANVVSYITDDVKARTKPYRKDK